MTPEQIIAYIKKLPKRDALVLTQAILMRSLTDKLTDEERIECELDNCANGIENVLDEDLTFIRG